METKEEKEMRKYPDFHSKDTHVELSPVKQQTKQRNGHDRFFIVLCCVIFATMIYTIVVDSMLLARIFFP
jgi:hypothetical protein